LIFVQQKKFYTTKKDKSAPPACPGCSGLYQRTKPTLKSEIALAHELHEFALIMVEGYGKEAGIKN
jgi:hypothetical protein